MSGKGMGSLAEPRAGDRQDKADRFQGRIDSLQGAPPIYLEQPGSNDGGKMAEFPARLIPKDARDSYVLDKEAAYEFEASKGHGNVIRTVGPEDIDYLRRKRAVLNRLEFDKWMTEVIDHTDPVQGKRKGGGRSKRATAAKKGIRKNKR
jgi:hypothetical protein